MDKYSIGYQKVSHTIHPTKFTDTQGNVLQHVQASDIGVLSDDIGNVASNYFIEELYYDSQLEKENIQKEIQDVVVFTKIPKNSIKIPVAGGKTYSHDFAYVINYQDHTKQLHFIVETKNVKDSNDLREEEKQKIKHAEAFFNGSVKIAFKMQFSNHKITQLIGEVLQGK